MFARWRAGDAAAGHELLERLRRRMTPFLRVKGRELAEDLLQELLIAVVRARDTLRDEEALKSYVYSTARRLLAREIERQGPAHDELDESILEQGGSLDAAYERRVAVASLRRCLADRSTLCTRAAELYYLEERRGPEIAARLAIPEGTVRSRIRRGLKQLRSSLGPS